MSQKATANRKSPTRDQILAAARELFASKGFKGTTTASIARLAGVNEAIIFRHFPAKKDLYTAILQSKLQHESSILLLETTQCRSLPVDKAVVLVAERFFESHEYDPLFLRLYYYSALEGHELAESFYEQFVRRFILLMDELIRRGIDEGKFRRVDSLLAAQAFIGMCRGHLLMTELFPDATVQRPREEVLETFTELFLKGISVR